MVWCWRVVVTGGDAAVARGGGLHLWVVLVDAVREIAEKVLKGLAWSG